MRARAARKVDEMTTETLKKLREFSRAESCEERAEAVGLRCHESASCAECLKATGEAAGALLDEVEKRLMPEGMEWPVFEDGEPVRIGDRVQLCNGHSEELCQVHMGESGYSLYTETSDEDHPYGVPVRRPEPEDTQERIDADAGKTPCEYFGWNGIVCDENGGCSASEMVGSCEPVKIKDLLRRQRELDAKEAGR